MGTGTHVLGTVYSTGLTCSERPASCVLQVVAKFLLLRQPLQNLKTDGVVLPTAPSDPNKLVFSDLLQTHVLQKRGHSRYLLKNQDEHLQNHHHRLDQNLGEGYPSLELNNYFLNSCYKKP